jgi:predicted Zn-dependent protease with MMP-like domain
VQDNDLVEVSRDSFEDLVRAAVAILPQEFLSKMGNVSIIVADRPTPAQRAENGLGPRDVLYGLYDGVPLPERGSYIPPLPDVITIFQEAIEDASASLHELEHQVRTTVIHEVAHYFGFSDGQLGQLGLA